MAESSLAVGIVTSELYPDSREHIQSLTNNRKTANKNKKTCPGLMTQNVMTQKSRECQHHDQSV